MVIKAIGLCYDYWRLKRLFDLLPDGKKINKRIVFNTIKVDPTTFAYEVFYAAILSKHGATTINIIDDGVFEHIDQIQYFETNKDMSRIRQFSTIKGKIAGELLIFLAKFCFGRHVKFVRTSEIEFNDTEVIDSTFDEIVESSARRFFKTPYLDKSDPHVHQYYRMSYSVCLRSKRIGEFILNELKADKVITSHGIYSTWAPAYEVVKKSLGPDVSIYGQLGHKKGEMLVADERLQLLGGCSEMMRFLSKGLSCEEERIISDYFHKRLSFKTEDSKVYYSSISDEFKFKKIGHVYAAFPNVITEADINERHIIFRHTLDWLIATIELFLRDTSNTLIIRCHPAEATMNKSKLSVEKEIYRLYPEIDSIANIHIIGSSLKIDTYSMIKNQIDIGIIYEGVLGLELALLSTPVIICGKGRLTDCSFGLEPKSKQEYERLLENPARILNNWDIKFMMKRALEIGYWNFFYMAYYIPTIADHYEKGTPFYKARKYRELRLKDIDTRHNHRLKRTVERLLSQHV